MPDTEAAVTEIVHEMIHNREYELAAEMLPDVLAQCDAHERRSVGLFLGLALSLSGREAEGTQFIDGFDFSEELEFYDLYSAVPELFAALGRRESALEALEWAVGHDKYVRDNVTKWHTPTLHTWKTSGVDGVLEMLSKEDFVFPEEPATKELFRAYLGRESQWDDALVRGFDALSSVLDAPTLALMLRRLLREIISDIQEHGDANVGDMWQHDMRYYLNLIARLEAAVPEVESGTLASPIFEAFMQVRFPNSERGGDR